MQIFYIFLDFPHYARLNKNFAKSRTMQIRTKQIRTKQIRTKQGPTVEIARFTLIFDLPLWL